MLCILAYWSVHFWLFCRHADQSDPLFSGSAAFILWKSFAITMWRNVNAFLAMGHYYMLSYCCFYGQLPEKLQKWKTKPVNE